MQRTLLIIAVMTLMIATTSKAQINQGAVLVGASSELNFTSYKPKNQESTSSFHFEAKAGYFVIDNLVFGLNLGYQKQEGYSSTMFGVFGRYYIHGKALVGLGYNSSKSGPNNDKATTTIVPIEVGYAAFINRIIAVEPSLRYSLYSGATEASAISLLVGFTLYLNRK